MAKYVLDTNHLSHAIRKVSTLRDRLRADVRIWPMNWPVVHAYGELRWFAKSMGIALSQVDLILASFAQSMDAILLTTDNDFQNMKTIKIENWTVVP